MVQDAGSPPVTCRRGPPPRPAMHLEGEDDRRGARCSRVVRGVNAHRRPRPAPPRRAKSAASGAPREATRRPSSASPSATRRGSAPVTRRRAERRRTSRPRHCKKNVTPARGRARLRPASLHVVHQRKKGAALALSLLRRLSSQTMDVTKRARSRSPHRPAAEPRDWQGHEAAAAQQHDLAERHAYLRAMRHELYAHYLRHARELLLRAERQPPSPGEMREFTQRLRSLARAAARAHAAIGRRFEHLLRDRELREAHLETLQDLDDPDDAHAAELDDNARHIWRDVLIREIEDLLEVSPAGHNREHGREHRKREHSREHRMARDGLERHGKGSKRREHSREHSRGPGAVEAFAAAGPALPPSAASAAAPAGPGVPPPVTAWSADAAAARPAR
jgi:hypothetical protein